MKLRRKYECMFVNGQKIQFSIIHVLVLYGFFGGDIAVDNFVDFVRFTEIKITRFKYFYVNFVSKHVVFGAFLKYMYIF